MVWPAVATAECCEGQETLETVSKRTKGGGENVVAAYSNVLSTQGSEVNCYRLWGVKADELLAAGCVGREGGAGEGGAGSDVAAAAFGTARGGGNST